MTKKELLKKFDLFLANVIPSKDPEVKPEESNEIELKEFKLEDGRIVSYLKLEVGEAINIIAEDKTLSPLENGDYVIDANDVTVEDGKITKVIKKEAPIIDEKPEVENTAEDKVNDAKLAKEKEVKLAKEVKEKVAKKELKLKADFEKKLEEERAKFKSQLEELANDVKLSSIVQAPIEDKTPKVPLTKKERMIFEIEKKRKNN